MKGAPSEKKESPKPEKFKGEYSIPVLANLGSDEEGLYESFIILKSENPPFSNKTTVVLQPVEAYDTEILSPPIICGDNDEFLLIEYYIFPQTVYSSKSATGRGLRTNAADPALGSINVTVTNPPNPTTTVNIPVIYEDPDE